MESGPALFGLARVYCMYIHIHHMYSNVICYSYTMVLGIYGSKPTKHEGGAQGRGVVYVAINNHSMSVIYPM